MKKGWFHHHDLTEYQANELIAQYKARNVQAAKALSQDYLSWTVSVLLPESKNPPRVDHTFQSKLWGEA
ncbi:Hypothetical protein AKI40_2471 [Enterobacter sp. FY-07]|uniref:hypothetical protein n=1 Tax=Kosakonia oryzendophytica TaxID=1005665 RepID=UPI00077793CC|nr:hypothetical protein [Kosakonia oryzendophytica]AMO48869.1 Hypothetical protein AKI40_2471 [Enterobacter sp. FY-07]WBT56625.1 hypothetical protein O9K67_15760 [Kosakonia oryzendophytica]